MNIDINNDYDDVSVPLLSIEDDTGHYRLTEHPQHGAADMEGPEPPQKKTPALGFL